MSDRYAMDNRLQHMLEAGLVIFGDEVDRRRVAKDAVISAGCKVFGSRTLICQGAELGQETPVTVNNCFVGPHVRLKGGYFENAVFLAGAQAGSGAHIRAGTILEEQASVAHTVGLKQTILFPYVTLGSLINFCDCFMSGGTGRHNHSEVGSSYIHFNFTPNQDKATASLIGDVPRGVMLDQTPIFLGGQGGLVGPCRIAYGTVIAAGSIYRRDQLIPDRLVFEGGGGRGGSVAYTTGIYRTVKRQATNNIIYLANLAALKIWYALVRRRFVGDEFPQPMYDGLTETLNVAIDERIKRFEAFCEKLNESKKRYIWQMGTTAADSLIHQKEQLYDHRHQVAEVIQAYTDPKDRHANPAFMAAIERGIGRAGCRYLQVIHALSSAERETGAAWLQHIVDDLTQRLQSLFPAIK
jgi:UDP-N-acetylglucosamine/UDP-N-acetylgalactosamine diphosphorylase